MIIIGIDPGSRNAGYGVIEVNGKKIKYLDSGVLKFGHIDEFMHRLGEIYTSFSDVIIKYKPEEIAIESLVYVKSATSYAKLSQARGAMIAAFMSSHLGKVYEYAPNLIKSSVSGHGHASKEGVEKSVEFFLGKRKFSTSDESDALAIAICHALNRKVKSAGTGAGTNISKGRSLKSVFKNYEGKK